MRRVSAGIVTGLGVVAVLLALAGFGLLGPDGVWRSGDTSVTLSPGSVGLVSTAGVVAFEGGELVVRADAGDHPVFVGIGHPVDVADVLRGRVREEVVDVARVGVRTTTLTPSVAATDPLADPAQETFWRASVLGVGAQEARVALDGTPTQYVVLSSAPQVTLSQGIHPVHIRKLLLALGLVGGALIAWSVMSRRRSRTGAGGEPALPPAAGSPRDGTSGEGGGLTLARSDQRGRPITRTLARLALTMLALGAVTACSAVPRPTSAWDPETVTKVALDRSDLAAMLADYDLRNNAAIVATHGTADPGPWAQADTGIVLEGDRFFTRLHAAQGDQSDPVTSRHTADEVYSPRFASYPMYAVVPVDVQWGDGQPRPRVGVWTKAGAAQPWLLALSYRRPSELAAPAADPTPTAEQSARAVAAAVQVRQGLHTAQPETLVEGTHELVTLLQSPAPGATSYTVEFASGGDADQGTSAGSTFIVQLADGSSLAVAGLTFRETITAPEGRVIRYPDAVAEATGLRDWYRSLDLRFGCSVGILVAPDGSWRLHGSQCGRHL